MRIAHLVIGGDVAGGQIVALALARGARARGDQILFLSPQSGPFTELVAAEGMAVAHADVGRTFRLGGAWRLAQTLRANRIDLLHTHTALAANVLSRLAARAAGVPVVSHLHIENHFPAKRARAAALRALDNATARLSARIVVVSEDTRRALARQGYPRESMIVVPNGIVVDHVDNRVGRTVRQELGISVAAPVVGEIGRLCEVKGQHDLLTALAELPGVQAILVGDDIEQGGAYRRRLEGQARELGIADRVLFTGYRRDAAALLDALDVFVLPSSIEGMPLVVLEAMARGKPVVATAVGGTGEAVLDGETGLLVPPGDPKRLATAIGLLLADPGLAERLGRAGRDRARSHYSEEAMTQRILELYDEIRAA